MKDNIVNNLKRVHQRIETACNEAGRAVDEVQLLLTKTVSAEKIRLAVEAGETIIGENKVQELRDKDAVLSSLPIERHFIGHLQIWFESGPRFLVTAFSEGKSGMKAR